MATGEAPVLEALVEINAVSLARVELDPATLLLVRSPRWSPSTLLRPHT
jgi:hypothetical protein